MSTATNEPASPSTNPNPSALYDLLLQSQGERIAREVQAVEGAIPAGLRGTVLRCGPGVFESGRDPLNFLDAHALVAGVSFEEGRAVLRAEPIDTPMRRAELAAGRMLERRLFTNLPGRLANAFKLDLGNNGGHDVYAFGGTVFTGQDGGHFAHDARTLVTQGEERWHGEAKRKELMSPMPRVDPKTKRLLTYVLTPGGSKPDTVRFLELDASRTVVARSEPVSLGRTPAVVHGHAFSERFYVVAEASTKLSVLPALLGLRTIFDALTLLPGQTSTLWLVPRGRPGAAVRVQAPRGCDAIFHCVNAFDDGDTLVLDCVGYGGYVNFNLIAPRALRARMGTPDRAPDAAPPYLYRIVIDTVKGTVLETKKLSTLPTEAPDLDRRHRGARARYYFGSVPDAAGDEPSPGFYGFYHAIARFDADAPDAPIAQWSAGPTKLVSPPAFAPDPASSAEGDGWLLSWVIDGATKHTDLVVLDARDVAKGPVARIALGVSLPGINHNNFEPDVLLAKP